MLPHTVLLKPLVVRTIGEMKIRKQKKRERKRNKERKARGRDRQKLLKFWKKKEKEKGGKGCEERGLSLRRKKNNLKRTL